MNRQKQKSPRIVVGKKGKSGGKAKSLPKKLELGARFLPVAVDLCRLALKHQEHSNLHEETMERLKKERDEVETKHNEKMEKIRQISDAYKKATEAKPDEAVELFKIFCEELNKI